MAETFIRLLLVEDNAGDARLFQEMLNERKPTTFAMTAVGRMTDAVDHLAANVVDVILLDLGLPDAQGLEAVRRAHAAAPRIPLVVLTGSDDESLADQALHEGAQDFLAKGRIETSGLLRAIRYATQRKKAELEMQTAQAAAEAADQAKGELLAKLQSAYGETKLFLRSIPSILIGDGPSGAHHSLEPDGEQHFRRRGQPRRRSQHRRLRNQMDAPGNKNGNRALARH